MMSVLAEQRVTEIVRLHDEIEGFYRASLTRAIRIGELLEEQKAALPFGQWLPWVDRLPLSEKTVQNYMKLFRNRDTLKSANVADLSTAYKLLAKPPKKLSPKPRMTADEVWYSRHWMIPRQGHRAVFIARTTRQQRIFCESDDAMVLVMPAGTDKIKCKVYHVAVLYNAIAMVYGTKAPIYNHDVLPWLSNYIDVRDQHAIEEDVFVAKEYNVMMTKNEEEFKSAISVSPAKS